MPALGPYSRAPALAKLDRRTKEARLLDQVRRDLIQHCGGAPSAVQRALIEQSAQLSLQIALMDAKAAAGGGFTAHDHRTYLAWCNTHSRLLRQLGMKGALVPARSLAEHLAERKP